VRVIGNFFRSRQIEDEGVSQDFVAGVGTIALTMGPAE
jgi:hypothetical protein